METYRLRVAIDATSLLGVRTGIGQVTSGLVQGLAERADVDLVAYAITWKGRGSLRQSLPPSARAGTRPFPARLTRGLWPRLAWPRIEGWTGRVDVVHATNFVAPPTRSPVLLTIPDLSYLLYPELCSGDVLRFPRLVQIAVDRGATVHTYTAFVAAQVRERYQLSDDRVVPVAPGLGPPRRGDPAQGQRLADAPRYVLALGTVEPRKNLPALVRAFDRVAAHDRTVVLVVAGPDGPGGQAFGAALARARHRERIHRLGWLDDRARDDLVAGATVLAYPSLYEGFGLPPLEAMQAGVPVVASTAGSLPEVLGDAAVLVDPGDDEGLSGALARVLDDGPLRGRLIEGGHAQAGAFTWERAVSSLVVLYRHLAGR